MTGKYYLTLLIYLMFFTLACLRVFYSCYSHPQSCAKESSLIKSASVKEKIYSDLRAYLPSPHVELLMGMVLGADYFDTLPIFTDLLKKTGTVHVVVVSGYNISLVFSFIFGFLGGLYKRSNFTIAVIGTLLFALFSGFEPPVVRAWVMGTIVIYAKYLGMSVNTFLVLIFTGIILIILKPSYFESLSFWLSFMATLSLVLFDVYFIKTEKENFVALDLKSSLAAQILVWPIISNVFGQVSIISPIVNMLVLWTIPISTMLGSALVISSLVHLNFFTVILAKTVYVFIDFFVSTVTFFSNISYASIEFKLPLYLFVGYYLFLFFLICRKNIYYYKH